jgi:hypothetical protein
MLVGIELLPISTVNISITKVARLAGIIKDPEINIAVWQILRDLYNYYSFTAHPKEPRKLEISGCL